MMLLYQLTQQINGTAPSVSSILPDPSQETFVPPLTAIVANILLFISLGLSLACAVAATLVQQWARNYIHTIERRPSAERRARMRMYLHEGIEKFNMANIIDGVPALLHLALFTFLLGLVFFIQPISVPIAITSIIILVISVIAYLFATFLPLFAFDSPIQTPLTSVIWQRSVIRVFYWMCAYISIVGDVVRLTLKPSQASNKVWAILDFFIGQLQHHSQRATERMRRLTSLSGRIFSASLRSIHSLRVSQWLSDDIDMKDLDSVRSSVARNLEYSAFSEREKNAFVWLVECLDEDKEIIPFIESIPAFLKHSDPSYDPYKTVSFLFRHPELRLYTRLPTLSSFNAQNNRVISASVEFLLGINEDDWMYIFSTTSVTPSQAAISLPMECPPGLHLQIRCLRGILDSCWLSLHKSPIEDVVNTASFWARPNWPERIMTLWQQMLEKLEVPQDVSQWPEKAHLLPYFALSRLVLDVAITNDAPVDIKPVRIALQMMLQRLPIPDHSWTCFDADPLPSYDEQRCYLTMISLIISAFDSKYVGDAPSLFSFTLSHLFHHLVHISQKNLLSEVDRILSAPFWKKYASFNDDFVRIVDAYCLTHRDDALSPQVMSRYRMLKLSEYDLPRLATTGKLINLHGLDPDMQTSFVGMAHRALAWLLSRPDNPIEDIIALFKAVSDVFCTFDDVEALRHAISVMDILRQQHQFLDNRECLGFLQRAVTLRTRKDVGVRVMIKPEQGVQTDGDRYVYSEDLTWLN